MKFEVPLRAVCPACYFSLTHSLTLPSHDIWRELNEQIARDFFSKRNRNGWIRFLRLYLRAIKLELIKKISFIVIIINMHFSLLQQWLQCHFIEEQTFYSWADFMWETKNLTFLFPKELSSVVIFQYIVLPSFYYMYFRV